MACNYFGLPWRCILRYSFSLFVVTDCDQQEIAKVFNDNYDFLVNYTLNGITRDEQRKALCNELSYCNPAVRVIKGAAYRTAKAQRTIDNGILSAEGCVMACITEKDFVCRDLDYFVSDGGKCALYSTTGFVFRQDIDANSPFYVGDNKAADHYIIYQRDEDPTPCIVTGKYSTYL